MPAGTVKPRVIVICGPTGVGKTASVLELAQSFKGEIVGADSMQIYRHMDIGTAKPTLAERARIPHHMIDIVDPDEPFDAQRFARMAQDVIFNMHANGITGFVAGGTGLYIKALTRGLFESKAADLHIRNRLKRDATAHGSPFLHDRLSQCDPVAARKIHPNDAFRIIRALEVYESTGKPISELHHRHHFKEGPFEVLKIGLNLPRETLYDQINRRVDAMINLGLLPEVKGLLARGYTAELKPMQAIGYRHMVDYIQGVHSWQEALRTLKRDTRRYAKRQLTWFNADPEIVWTDPGRISEMRRSIKRFLQGQ